MQILLIEDDAKQAYWIARQLEEYGRGISVHIETSLRDAIAWLQEQADQDKAPDIICFDPGIPGAHTANLKSVVQQLSKFTGGDSDRIRALTGAEPKSTVWAALSYALKGDTDEFDQPRIFQKEEVFNSTNGFAALVEALKSTHVKQTSGGMRYIVAIEAKLAALEVHVESLRSKMEDLRQDFNRLNRQVLQGGNSRPSIADVAWGSKAAIAELTQDIKRLEAAIDEITKAGEDEQRIVRLQRIEFFYRNLDKVIVVVIAIAVVSLLSFLGISIESLVGLFEALLS